MDPALSTCRATCANVFLDIRAAYDSVDRKILWRKCRDRGLPDPVLLDLLRALFDNNEAFVAIAGRTSDRFRLLAGVLQGSILSPLLYSTFIDDLPDMLNSECPPGDTDWWTPHAILTLCR